MPCQPQVFPGVTSERFAALAQKMIAAGFALTGNAGEVTDRGVTVGWLYEPVGEVLTVTCVDKPWYVNCGRFVSEIQKWMEET